MNKVQKDAQTCARVVEAMKKAIVDGRKGETVCVKSEGAE
jgi:hypothetical protein